MAKGIEVDDLVVYRTLPKAVAKEEISSLLSGKKIDFITFTSSSTVKNFMAILGADNIQKLSHPKIICIGPVTAETAKELGLTVAGIADTYTIDGLVDKLIQLKG